MLPMVWGKLPVTGMGFYSSIKSLLFFSFLLFTKDLIFYPTTLSAKG